MISILVAAAVGLAVALLGTPVAIRAFTLWGWGQRIREDGPHLGQRHAVARLHVLRAADDFKRFAIAQRN